MRAATPSVQAEADTKSAVDRMSPSSQRPAASLSSISRSAVAASGTRRSASASTMSASPSLVESEYACRKSSTPPNPVFCSRIASTRRRARKSIRPSAADCVRCRQGTLPPAPHPAERRMLEMLAARNEACPFRQFIPGLPSLRGAIRRRALAAPAICRCFGSSPSPCPAGRRQLCRRPRGRACAMSSWSCRPHRRRSRW